MLNNLLGVAVKLTFKLFLLTVGISLTSNSFALPIDWNGSVGFDSNIITNARRTSDNCTTGNGSECIADGNDHGRYQSYILKLNPSIIVNDSATIKGEISTGSFRGGFYGGDTEWGGDYDTAGSASASYYNTQAGGNNGLVLNQLYAELYADTALFRIGKYSKHFGLGAVLNDGKNTWDRYFTLYDGFEAEFKLGSFTMTPHWVKIASDATRPSGQYDILEKGLTALYDNSTKNMKFGVYYGIRESESSSPLYNNAGTQNVNIIDVFIEKKWGDFKVAVEIPMLSGEVGDAYGTGANANFETNAYILETSYMVNPRWELGFNAGLVKGDDGTTNNFEGMYLHPNYQMANLMFAYDYQGFNNANRNIFQSSITNTQYMKFYANYMTDAWTWKMSFMMATAQAVAENGKAFYDHENRDLIASAAEDQDADLGYEVDFGFDYLWNPSIVVNGFVGYHKVGDYYAFDNNAGTEIELTDVMSYGFRVSVDF
jgi:hypothetical protein